MFTVCYKIIENQLLQEHGIYLKEPYVKAIKGAQYKGLVIGKYFWINFGKQFY